MPNQNEEHEQITICKSFFNADNYEKALEELDKYLAVQPDDENLLNDKGIILTKLRKYEEALNYFKRAIDIAQKKSDKPISGIIWNNRGLTYCHLGKFKDAISCFKNAYDTIGKNYTNALNNEGLAYYYLAKTLKESKEEKEMHFKRAIECFDNVLKLNPRNSHALNNKGSTFLELGWNEEAKKYIDKAIEFDETNANAWNNKGRIVAISSNYQEAINYYNKAIEIKKGNHREAWNNKGIALTTLANLSDDEKYFSDAEKCYDMAIKMDKGFVSAINNKAMLYANRHNFVKAEELINKSLVINKHDQETMDKKGIILFHLKKYDEALVWFQNACENYSDNGFSRYHMGNTYTQLKKYNEAIECFDDALRENLTFAEAHNAKALALYNQGKEKAALKEIKRAIEIKPSLAVANENIVKLTSTTRFNIQNFWDFWKSSKFKRIVGATLLMFILSTVGSITFHIVSNIVNGNDVTKQIPLKDISEGYLIVLGITIFLLLIPEIRKAKLGPMEFELQEQHIHPTNDSPSLSEEHHLSPYLR